MHTRSVIVLITLVLAPALALCGDAPTNLDCLAITADCKLTHNGEQYFCINEVKDLATDEVIMAGGISSQIGVEGSAKTKIEMPEGMRTIIITTKVEPNRADVQLRIMDGDKEVRRMQTVLSLTESSK